MCNGRFRQWGAQHRRSRPTSLVQLEREVAGEAEFERVDARLALAVHTVAVAS